MTNLQKGDNILINYNNGITKLATFLNSNDGNNLFADINGDFILSDKFIANSGIILTVIED